MKKLALLLFILSIGLTTYAQKKVGGVTLPEKLVFGKTTLKLNGAGVREKMWLDLYACGLYVKNTSSNATEIISSKESMGMKLHIVSSLISSKKMNDAVEEGFKKATGGKTKALREKIDAFKAIFSKEEIKKGDIYDIMYIPSKGTVVFKNGKVHSPIEGHEFKKALFAIWLGSKPADEDLKEDLLGN